MSDSIEILRPLGERRMKLGECPVWSVRDQALYWIDIEAPSVLRFDPASGETREWPMPTHPGAIALYSDGSLMVALRTGLRRFGPATGSLTHLADPDYDPETTRYNDGRCDRRGRFWIGSMYEPRDKATAKLYRYEKDVGLVAVFEGITVSNGLAWSPDGLTMYHADTPTRTVFAYDYDPDTGTPSRKRPFASVPENMGKPDGAAVDANGGYWSALVRGGAIARFTPDGNLDRVIDLPVSRPTMCCFGGRDLETLYVTSIGHGLDARERESHPEGGALLALTPGVKGLPEPAMVA